jgi:hypothetical protein
MRLAEEDVDRSEDEVPANFKRLGGTDSDDGSVDPGWAAQRPSWLTRRPEKRPTRGAQAVDRASVRGWRRERNEASPPGPDGEERPLHRRVWKYSSLQSAQPCASPNAEEWRPP